jgi:hypothetical protein
MSPVPLFSVADARAVLLELMTPLAEFVVVRADIAELGASVRGHSLSGAADAHDLNRRLDELMQVIQETGVQVKGWAPILLDFPAVLDGENVLLCWLEGDLGLSWYHRAGLGFAGRRPLRFDA